MDWPFLSGLGMAEREQFLALGRRRTLVRHEVVCHEGDPADALYLVVTGHLSVRVSLASGHTAMINVVGPGGCFGELALLRTGGQRTATVAALDPTTILAISATRFRQLCATRPEVERTLSTLLADRVEQLSERVLEQSYLGVDRRVYRRLHELAGAYASPGGPAVVPLTQSQLAELTGATRPTVNLALRRLVDQQIVALHRGRIEILDPARLRPRSGL